MKETILAVFDTVKAADMAVQDLKVARIPIAVICETGMLEGNPMTSLS